jgi:hypothetical protein
MASPVLLALWCLFLETSASNILPRRASRLRKLTGNLNIQCASVIEQRNMSAGNILASTLNQTYGDNAQKILPASLSTSTQATSIVCSTHSSKYSHWFFRQFTAPIVGKLVLHF